MGHGFNEFDPNEDTERLQRDAAPRGELGFNEFDPNEDTERALMPQRRVQEIAVSMNSIRTRILKVVSLLAVLGGIGVSMNSIRTRILKASSCS